MVVSFALRSHFCFLSVFWTTLSLFIRLSDHFRLFLFSFPSLARLGEMCFHLREEPSPSLWPSTQSPQSDRQTERRRPVHQADPMQTEAQTPIRGTRPVCLCVRELGGWQFIAIYHPVGSNAAVCNHTAMTELPFLRHVTSLISCVAGDWQGFKPAVTLRIPVPVCKLAFGRLYVLFQTSVCVFVCMWLRVFLPSFHYFPFYVLSVYLLFPPPPLTDYDSHHARVYVSLCFFGRLHHRFSSL